MLKDIVINVKQNRNFILILCLIFTCSFTLTLSKGSVDLELYEKWRYEKRSYILGILDLNADGLDEILINSPDENSLVCLNYAGEEIWRYPILENPSLVHGNLSMDICSEIVVTSTIRKPIQSTLISCLNYKGDLLWEKTIDFDILEPLDILDFDNDNQKEIVLIGEESVYTFDEVGSIKYLAELGNEIIQDLYYHYARELPLIIDYLNDEVYDLLFKIDDSFLCYNLTGYLFWNYTIVEPGSEDRWVKLGPVASDFTGDGEIEIFCLYLVEESKLEAIKVLQLNTSGSEILKKEIIFTFFWDKITSLRDVNSDGILDFVIVSHQDGLHCVSVNSSLVWSDKEIIDWCCPNIDLLIFDLFGDNRTEIIANMYNDPEGITILDSEGNLLEEGLYPDNKWRIKAFMDFDLDGFNDFLLEENGRVCCYGIITDKSKLTERGYEFNSLIQNYRYIDQDFDYLSDMHETIYNCSISDSDTDNDKFLDGWELNVGLNPLLEDSNLDSDNDGLSNFEEISEYHTSIFLSDSDGDGISDINDKNEIKTLGEASFNIFSVVVLSSVIVILVITRVKKKNFEVKKIDKQ
ncbi:MAG: hypothetical protein H7644_03870 [Candidatus Heimdallarchaeota archaeon]|nr:hypothetical protein [Candidatus Heimdallarchaeota archaeon]MCK5142880.1 hypothetical protein [Candidatus Heimdallarchaeota archaeon]